MSALAIAPTFADLDRDISRIPPLFDVVPQDDGRANIEWNFHEGQLRAWDSQKRFILVLAGSQSGKTSFTAPWLLREIMLKGPGDYGVVAPTFSLLELKLLGEFTRLFVDIMGLGKYIGSPTRQLTITPEGEIRLFGARQRERTRIHFHHAQDPDSIESATYKAMVLDEPGQHKFRRGSWAAARRRITLHRGRVLLTTTPYVLHWLKDELFDPWDKAGGNHPDIEVVNFASNMNPMFSQAEFEMLRATLPAWYFKMFHLGLFTRPAGLIYDCFSEDANTIDDFDLPEDWRRFVGVDFGGVNTAGVFVAEEKNSAGQRTGRYFGYREYHQGGRTAVEHARAMLSGEPRRPHARGGAKSEGQWRKEFAAGGLAIGEPKIAEVEPGILRVYKLLKEENLVFFKSLTETIEQVKLYSRVIDRDSGLPTEAIEDKETYHLLDSLRYIAPDLTPSPGGLI